MKHPLALLALVALVVSFGFAGPTTAQTQTYDYKVVQGAACVEDVGDFVQPAAGTTLYATLNRSNVGSVAADSAGLTQRGWQYAYVHCPFVRDSTVNVNGLSAVVINAYDTNPDDELKCMLYAAAPSHVPAVSGTNYLSTAWTGSGVAFAGGFVSITMPALTRSWINGDYDLVCVLPESTVLESVRYSEFGGDNR